MKTFVKVTALATLAAASLNAFAAPTNGTKYGDWEGVCQGNECGIIQVQYNNDKVPVGRVVLQKMKQAGNNPVAIITVPLGVNLPAGMGIAVDGKEIARLPFNFCDQGGCNVAIPLQGDVLNKIKAGNKLQVAAFVGDKQQTVVFSLSGVSKAISAL